MNVELLKKQQEAIFLTDDQPVVEKKRNFSLAFTVSPDEMEASLKITTSDPEYGVSEFDIVSGLFNNGIRAGILYSKIESAVTQKLFNQNITIAVGVAPENGQPARLMPQMPLQELSAAETAGGAPAAGIPVEMDQALIVKQPATPGLPGVTVRGRNLAPVPGADVDFETGGNVTISDDGLRLIAAIPGLAGLSGGKPCVREPDYGDWKFNIKLRKENMEALLVIVPGVQERPNMDDAFIHGILEAGNIRSGVLPEIATHIPMKIAMTTVINMAKGKPPAPGKDAVIVERFRENAGKDQLLFPVEKGKMIVEKIPVKPGEEGRNVLGETIAPEPGKDFSIVAGAGTSLSGDKLKLTAGIDGYVSRVKDAYCVVPCMKFDPARVPLPKSINFDGVILIAGDVPPDHTIIAGHHIVIQGNVTAAEVIAGGFLQVSGTITDCVNTKIQATGDMYLASATRSRLRAGGGIWFSGKALNCETIAGGGIYGAGESVFSIIGGRMSATRNIEADDIGAPQAQTSLEAGVPFALRVRYEHAIQEASAFGRKQQMISNEMKRIVFLVKSRQAAQGDIDNLRKLNALNKTVAEKLAQQKTYLGKLLPAIRSMSSDAGISAGGAVHPGTVLKIGIHTQRIQETLDGALFNINKDQKSIESRKLKKKKKREVTVMFTDIVGYSSYTSKHGDVAASTLLNKHNELLFPLVDSHNGWLVKTIGDSILAVFEKPDDGLRCAISMQKTLEEHNTGTPADHKIKIRIGINTGIGIIEDNDIFGDVVNMAARVESLTNGDEIRISDDTFSALQDKTFVAFRSLGLQKLKGKEEMVEILDVIWED